MFPHPTLFFSFILLIFISGCVTTPPETCTENWTCDDWSTCENNSQTRTCVDSNACGTISNKPATTQACNSIPVPVCGDGVCEGIENEILCAADCRNINPQPVADVPLTLTLGAEETVFDYEQDACAQMDLPDMVAHPFRNHLGELVLASGNAPDNYWMFGTNFNDLQRDCTPILRSGDKWPVETFDHQEWVGPTYTEDGKTIHALVHNEYHDPYSPLCLPGVTDPSNRCWYNFISYARSTDGGHTFTQPASPNHLVAVLPLQWDANSGNYNQRLQKFDRPAPYGYMEPTTIVKKDGFYYAMVRRLSNPKGGDDVACVMRTDNLNDPASWKFWDGENFSIPLTNPYPNEPVNPQDLFCAPVVLSKNGSLNGSLTYNTYLERYMIVGAATLNNDAGELTCGFWYILSNDLITWSKPHLLRETVLGWPPCDQPTPAQQALSIDQEAYPSIIDHDSTSRNFETADETVYLYWMQNQDNHNPGGWGLRRNLVRVPVTFTKLAP